MLVSSLKNQGQASSLTVGVQLPTMNFAGHFAIAMENIAASSSTFKA